MDARSRDRFSSVLNGVAYRMPASPVAVVCVDDGDPEYLAAAGAAGLIPTITRFMREGFSARLPGQILQVITQRFERLEAPKVPCVYVGDAGGSSLAERAKTRRVLRFLPLDKPSLIVGQDDVACWHDSPGAPCGKVCQ